MMKTDDGPKPGGKVVGMAQKQAIKLVERKMKKKKQKKQHNGGGGGYYEEGEGGDSLDFFNEEGEPTADLAEPEISEVNFTYEHPQEPPPVYDEMCTGGAADEAPERDMGEMDTAGEDCLNLEESCTCTVM